MAENGEERVDEARRRLAKMGLYSVPAVLGVLVVRNAGASANPSCNPFTMGMGMGMGMGNMGMGNMGGMFP